MDRSHAWHHVNLKRRNFIAKKVFESKGWQSQDQKRIFMIKVQPLDLKMSKTSINLDLAYEEESSVLYTSFW